MKNCLVVPAPLRLLKYLALIGLVVFQLITFCRSNSVAQSVLDNGTSVGLAPGAPAGSYPLGDFDNINLFSGNLNFTLPLLDVSGRGETRTVMKLPIESHWTNLYYFQNPLAGYFNPIPEYNFPNGLKPGYGPGVLMLRSARTSFGPCGWSERFQTKTRLVFVMADGTEFELRDTIYDGAPLLSPTGCGLPTQSRGDTFVTADGTSVTFISDTAIDDQFTYSRNLFGYLMLRDGTRYRIDDGLVTWMRDRNGNKLEFTYTNDRVTLIKDSLNRQITIQYNVNDSAPFGLCDKITFNGFGGQARILRISYANLSTVLAAGHSLQSKNQMFPQVTPDWVNSVPGMTNNFDTSVVSSVWLPDGGTSRRYRFFYNSYGELARAELPTGGAYEYDWEASPFMSYDDAPQEILRRVKERRVYNGTSLERKTLYSYDLPSIRSGETMVVVDNFDGQSTPQRINRERHSFHGTPIPRPYRPMPDLYIDSPWTQGKEYETEWLAGDGVTVLKRTAQTWRQRASVTWWTCSGCTPDNAPIKDPRVVETITTLPDTNQVSKQTSIDPADQSGQTVGFDQFNNQTDVWEYDFGTGAPGAFVRRVHTDYVVTGNYVSANTNPALGAHLRALPSQQWISSDVGGANKASLTTYEYDNYANDTRHKPLVSRASITGHDAAYSNSFTVRGNLTGTTSYINAQSATGPVILSLQYDIAGNIVAAVDGLEKVSTHSFADSFCNGSTCGGTFNANTFAFLTGTTSPVPDPTGQYGSSTALSKTQSYDFWTGRVTSKTDPNGQTTTFQFNDVLDRPTAILRPSGGARTDFEYGDTVGNLFVRTISDLDATRRLDSYQFFDGLGRVIESRRYENSTQYISVKEVPFITQQDPDSGLWLAATQKSNPFRPTLGEQPAWSTVFLDALGRSIKVRTPDNAIIRTSYSGNSTTVTDPAGKVRKSVTDAFGRLIRIDEDPVVPGGPAEFDYQTTYTYDVLDNLVKVTQGSQQRFFKYDSLKRLIRARNPEQATLAGLTLQDSLTGNDNWSIGYQYNANHNLTQKTDPRNVVSTYAYDALNRVTTVNYSDTPSINPDIKRVYDGAANGKGRVWYHYTGGDFSTGSNVEHTSIDSYDALGRPLVQRQLFKLNGTWSNQTYQTVRTYNRAGAVLTQSYPSGRSVTYNYDNAGRLGDKDASNLAFTGNLGDGGAPRTYAAGIAYSPWNQITIERFGTQTTLYHKLQYNIRGQLWDVRVATGSDVNGSWNRGALQFFYDGTYGFGTSGPDNNGNALKAKHYVPLDDSSSTWAIHDQNYTYDSLNRLASTAEYFVSSTQSQTPQSLQSYTYDRWGNRSINTSSWGTGVNVKQFSIDPATNRYGVPVGQSGVMTYDDAGNLTNDTYTGAGTRTYDAENRMVAAQDGYSGSSYYSYNADGQRVRRKVNNQETWYIYGMEGELLAEYAATGATGSPQKEYGYRNGQLLITASPAPSGLVGFWKLDENTGTTAADSSGSGNTGTLTSGAGWASGQSGSAANLDGVNDYVQVGSQSSLAMSTAASFSAWIYPTGPGSDPTYGGVIVNREGEYEIVRFPNGTIQWAFANSNPGWNFVNTGYVAPLNQWTHLAITYSNGTINTYANGNLVHTYNGAGSIGDVSTGQNDFRIGGRQAINQYFQGRIDEVRTYNRALTADEVSTLPGGGFQVNWLVPDHVGTPRIVVDLTGSRANVKRHDYLPFGEELYAGTGGRSPGIGYTGDGVRQQFTSQERDAETGLDYFRARYYSSTLGRFTGVDPGSFAPADPQSWNRYIYTQNNPLKFIDPTGQDLYILGLFADQIIADLEIFSGLKLKRDTTTGKVTIDASQARKIKKTSLALASALRNAIGKTNINVSIYTMSESKGTAADGVLGDRFQDRKLDIDDYNVFKKDAPQFAAAVLTHVITEYTEAQLLPSVLSNEELFRQAHATASEAESETLGDFNGWWQKPREEKTGAGSFNSPPLVLRFIYSTVEYDIVCKIGKGGKATQVDQVITVDKTPKKPKK